MEEIDPAHLPSSTLAMLGWSLEEKPAEYPDGYRAVQLRPCLPWFAADTDDVVLDLLALLRSALYPGAYDLITSSTGDGDEWGIVDGVYVSHPHPEWIVWELDWRTWGPLCQSALAGLLSPDGVLALRFERGRYEADIRAMWAQVQEFTEGCPDYELQPLGVEEQDTLGRALQGSSLPANRFGYGSVLPPATVLEFSLAHQNYCHSEGWHFSPWPGRWCPNVATHRAFLAWITCFPCDRFTAPADPTLRSRQVVPRESWEACDLAGERFVALLRHAWASSCPPQRVLVQHRPCAAGSAQGDAYSML